MGGIKMYRLLRIVLLLLVSLDVAFFPFSCRGNRDQNKVYIHIMTEQQDEEGNLYYDPAQVYPKLHRTFSNFRIGDTIKEEDVLALMETLEPQDEEKTASIVKYQMMVPNAIHKDITLPYTVTEEDKLNYYQGIRGAAHFVVIVKEEAKQDNPEN